jgi:hypothetical protein
MQPSVTQYEETTTAPPVHELHYEASVTDSDLTVVTVHNTKTAPISTHKNSPFNLGYKSTIANQNRASSATLANSDKINLHSTYDFRSQIRKEIFDNKINTDYICSVVVIYKFEIIIIYADAPFFFLFFKIYFLLNLFSYVHM